MLGVNRNYLAAFDFFGLLEEHALNRAPIQHDSHERVNRANVGSPKNRHHK